MKRYYVTKKRVDAYIASKKGSFESVLEFKQHLLSTIGDLKQQPTFNRNQIRFFSRVYTRLTEK